MNWTPTATMLPPLDVDVLVWCRDDPPGHSERGFYETGEFWECFHAGPEVARRISDARYGWIWESGDPRFAYPGQQRCVSHWQFLPLGPAGESENLR